MNFRRSATPAPLFLGILVSVALALGLFAINSSNGVAHAAPGECEFGASVYSYTQGTGFTGTSSDVDDPAEALGEADGSWVSLGNGGSIVIGFDTLIDGPGPDFRIYEIETPEIANVEISAGTDPTGPFTVVGQAGIGYTVNGNVNITTFNIGNDDGASRLYVQITDDGNSANGTTVGFDLDSIAAVNCEGVAPDFPDIQMQKYTNGVDADSPSGVLVDVDDPITWTYEVFNTGNLDLVNVDVIDDQGEDVSCPATTLAVGESMICAASALAQPGQYANVGTVTAETELGEVVSDSDPSHYFARVLPDEADECEYAASIYAYNPGTGFPGSGDDADDPLEALGPSDGMFVSLGNGGSIILEFANLVDGVGRDVRIYEVGSTEQAEVQISAGTDPAGPFTVIGTAGSGSVLVGNLNVTDLNIGLDNGASRLYVMLTDDNDSGSSSTAGFDLDTVAALNCGDGSVLTPSVSIEKATNGEDADSPTGPVIAVGDPVDWTYEVTNTGDTALSNIMVLDDQGESVTCPQVSLAVGESMTCTASGIAEEGQYANVGSVTAEAPDGSVVSDDDPSHYFGETVVACENPDPAGDLSGSIMVDAGLTEAWGTIVNEGDCAYEVGLASYKKYDEIIDNQDIFDYTVDANETSIGPNTTLEVHVDLPACAAQIDLFYGEVLLSLDGVRYGDRKLDYLHVGGSNYCAPAGWDAGTTGDLEDGVKINFQIVGAPVPSGYVADVGAAYGDQGNGLTFGWNMSNPHGRDRNASNSPDQRHDTLNHMQKVENPNGKWEIEVPDGTYEVYVVAGDASYTDSVYKIAAEGSVVVSGTPNSWNRWFNGSATVTVTDGKLTISNASGSNNNKIDFIHITLVDDTPPAPEPEPAEEIDVKINFQNGSASVPNGYLKDSGSAFGNRGNGYTYGWNGSNDNGRDRNSWRSSSQKYDTLNHMQMGGNRFWEIAVPNGTYEVRIVAGDPDYTDSVYKIKVEGTTAISGTPSWSKRWFEKTLEVEVTDGKLTISNAWGASNNKISFVEITTAD